MERSLVYLACLTSILPCVPACGGRDLDAGREPQNIPDAGPEMTRAQHPATCPPFTWGDVINPHMPEVCVSLALGRWRLCFDDGGVTRGDSGTFVPQPDGIEFAQVKDPAPALLDLAFFLLVQDANGALVRSTAPSQRGYVQVPALLGSTCWFGLALDSNYYSDLTEWSFQVYENPTALLVNGNAAYIPTP
jgi:hypothetical protein